MVQQRVELSQTMDHQLQLTCHTVRQAELLYLPNKEDQLRIRLSSLNHRQLVWAINNSHYLYPLSLHLQLSCLLPIRHLSKTILFNHQPTSQVNLFQNFINLRLKISLFLDISLQSPLQPSMPIRSPFVGPSPSSTTPNPAQSNYNQSMAASNREEDRQQTQQSQSKSSSSQQTGQNQHSQSSSGTASSSLNTTSALLLNQHQYKKFHSASIPIYLSENGFLKMLSKDATSNYCPLEVFLASSHMRKKLIKYVRSDSATFMIKNQDQNIYRTYLFEFQILNDISPSTYHAFALQLTQTSPVDLPTDLIQRYFSTRVICPPYKSSQAISFFNMLSTNEPKVFKDFMQLLDFELNSAAYKSYAWRFKFCWCLPNGYVPRSNKPGPVLSFYQNASQIGFSRRDKYYFLIYLHYQQPVQQQRTFSPPVILLFCVYDSAMNNCYFEIFKPLSEANNNLYNIYENYISSIVTASKQKGIFIRIKSSESSQISIS